MTTSQAVGKKDQVGLAIMAMVFTDLTLSISDAIIKVTVSDMPLLQFIVLRCGITVPLLVLILKLRCPQVSLRPVFPAWAILRSAMLLVSLLLYYASLPRLDFSTAAAVYYTIPLFTTLFAAVWIREPVGAQGWTAVGIGFGGVLLMLKPQAGDLNIFAVLPLTAAMLYALGMVVTRTKNRGEHPLVLALTFNLTAIGLCAVVICIAEFGGTAAALHATGSRFLGEWIAIGWFQWGLVMMLSMMMLIGSVGTAIAYQLGPPSVISTWDFSYLAFAVLWSVILFSERLDAMSMLGIALIALAGIIATRRRPAPR
ncbi:DMT family transporter [bacterium M00.F.Ca.ET.152.01.1.1]|nr:DMT family transporter [bacterium M00.F.Ca.ET.152.01.1.1]